MIPKFRHMDDVIKKAIQVLMANKKLTIAIGVAVLIVVSCVNGAITAWFRSRTSEKLDVKFSPKPEQHELTPDNPREFGFLTIGQQGLELRQQDWDSSIQHLILNAKAHSGQPVDPQVIKQKLEMLDRLIKAGENARRAHPEDAAVKQRLMILRMQRSMLTAVK